MIFLQSTDSKCVNIIVLPNVCSCDTEVPQLRSYHNATRVHFNPQFPELVVARKALVTRLSEKNDGHCLALHTVKRVVDLDGFEA